MPVVLADFSEDEAMTLSRHEFTRAYSVPGYLSLCLNCT
ncbi:hypothetical protein QMY54_03983 [Pseudomonas rhodesiae]|jgi:hypothetical protein|nr:hypothetical protein QMY54_03983 [Pseudomonas rhodesiae]